ncbi:MAG: Rrf2 family transcriptional regulator [Pyrinomonadaceae bacterium]|nr:Rrf2 family transcriptional regulator [Pyrinomonadaceae bacterium]
MANSQFAMAVHVLAMLANNCDERIKSGYLAESVNTNAVVIRRLLCDLHDAELVVSRTGYSGGTCLTRQPSAITLDEVFDAVSKADVFGLHPNQPKSDCEIGAGITSVLERLQEETNLSVRNSLGSYSLQDVIDEVVRIDLPKKQEELVT